MLNSRLALFHTQACTEALMMNSVPTHLIPSPFPLKLRTIKKCLGFSRTEIDRLTPKTCDLWSVGLLNWADFELLRFHRNTMPESSFVVMFICQRETVGMFENGCPQWSNFSSI